MPDAAWQRKPGLTTICQGSRLEAADADGGKNIRRRPVGSGMQGQLMRPEGHRPDQLILGQIHCQAR